MQCPDARTWLFIQPARNETPFFVPCLLGISLLALPWFTLARP